MNALTRRLSPSRDRSFGQLIAIETQDMSGWPNIEYNDRYLAA